MLTDNLGRTHFPYCLDRQADGSYVVLNRNYKPIGFLMDEWANYGDFPIGVRLPGLTAEVASKLSDDGSRDLSRIYLYADHTRPTNKTHKKAYFERLAILMDLKIGS